MAKRVDALKAKQARQKKVAIVLVLVLVLVMAYQGPKTLKMLKGPSAAAAPAPTTPPVTPATPVTPGAPAPVATPVTPGATPTQPAVLADSDTPVAPGAGQLLSFERFTSSDPFKQQVDTSASAESAEAGAGSDGTAAPAEKPPTPAPKPAAPVTPVVPVEPETTPPAANTTISINGVVEVVSESAGFPAEDPLFQLVSLGKDGKSVEIGVAGGSISGGAETVKLALGRPLTLQNTANGSRYVLVLESVAGFVTPKSTK